MHTPTMKTRPHQLARTAMCLLLMLALPVHAETATLQHDSNGNVTQRTTPLGTTTYQYDALERIINETGPAKTQSFNYDENGNRLKDGAGTTNNYTIDPNANRFVTTPYGTPTYDAAGRMTADGTGRTFGFNQAGQLYQVKQGGTLLATYYYDANGLRSRKMTTASAPQGAQTILFEYDEEGHLISEISGTGAPLHTYAWRDNTPVAQIDYQPSRKILSFDPDHLNTPRAAMDSTGKVVWRWESDAFGSTLPDEDPDKDGNKTTVNLRFGGWYADVESGLFYAKNRYYSPPAGRFITPDPIGLAGGSISIYTYVDNNPMSFTDPLGLFPMYGNWGGENYSGGKWQPTIPSNPAPPKDAYDACYAQHDYCIAVAHGAQSSNSCSAKPTVASCDVQLAHCTLAVPSGTGGWYGSLFGTLSASWAVFKGAGVFGK